jgi:putative ATP-binding cassette transporter
MSAQTAPLNRQTARRFVRAVRDLLTSEVRRKAIGLLVLLLVFALSVNGLNVVNGYVGRDFMTAIAGRDMPGFARLAILYIGVFAVATVVAVLYRFSEERLGLLWRSWLTKRVTARYLARRTYLRLRESAEIDNPDQRIAEDIRAFTTSTLSFTLIFLNAILAAVSFSGVLWTISPLLFGVAVGSPAQGRAQFGRRAGRGTRRRARLANHTFIGRAAATRYDPPYSRAAVVCDTGSGEYHPWIGSARAVPAAAQ